MSAEVTPGHVQGTLIPGVQSILSVSSWNFGKAQTRPRTHVPSALPSNWSVVMLLWPLFTISDLVAVLVSLQEWQHLKMGCIDSVTSTQ